MRNYSAGPCLEMSRFAGERRDKSTIAEEFQPLTGLLRIAATAILFSMLSVD
jgi:hypothetical protein